MLHKVLALSSLQSAKFVLLIAKSLIQSKHSVLFLLNLYTKRSREIIYFLSEVLLKLIMKKKD